jgi:hypothetical protein
MKTISLPTLASRSIVTGLLFCFFVILLGATANAQASATQTKDPSWETLSEQYEVPQWFTDARF